jgi:hypothetical protein
MNRNPDPIDDEDIDGLLETCYKSEEYDTPEGQDEHHEPSSTDYHSESAGPASVNESFICLPKGSQIHTNCEDAPIIQKQSPIDFELPNGAAASMTRIQENDSVGMSLLDLPDYESPDSARTQLDERRPVVGTESLLGISAGTQQIVADQKPKQIETVSNISKSSTIAWQPAERKVREYKEGVHRSAASRGTRHVPMHQTAVVKDSHPQDPCAGTSIRPGFQAIHMNPAYTHPYPHQPAMHVLPPHNYPAYVYNMHPSMMHPIMDPPMQQAPAVLSSQLSVPSYPMTLDEIEEAIAEETQRIRDIEQVLEARKIKREELRIQYARLLASFPHMDRPHSSQTNPISAWNPLEHHQKPITAPQRSSGGSPPTEYIPDGISTRTHVSFTLILDRPKTDIPIGLSVAFDDSRGVFLVTGINNNGLVHDANVKRAVQGGKLPLVEPGDFVVSINGVSGDKPSMAQQLASKRIQLVFVKDT